MESIGYKFGYTIAKRTPQYGVSDNDEQNGLTTYKSVAIRALS